MHQNVRVYRVLRVCHLTTSRRSPKEGGRTEEVEGMGNRSVENLEGIIAELRARVEDLEFELGEAEDAKWSAEAEYESLQGDLKDLTSRPLEEIPKAQLWDQIREFISWPQEAPSSMPAATTSAVHQSLLEGIQRTLFGRS